jgi:hypothetical protein
MSDEWNHCPLPLDHDANMVASCSAVSHIEPLRGYAFVARGSIMGTQQTNCALDIGWHTYSIRLIASFDGSDLFSPLFGNLGGTESASAHDDLIYNTFSCEYYIESIDISG